MDKQVLDDEHVGEMLRQRYALEVDRSAVRAAELLDDVVARPTVRRATRGHRQLGSVTFAVVAVAVTALLLRSGPLLSQDGAGSATGSPTATLLAPTASQTVGTGAETTGGIPTNIAGQPVLVGAAAAEAIASSKDQTPILVGGWFHAGDDRVCLVYGSNWRWEGCNRFALYAGETGSDKIWIYPANPPTVYAPDAAASTREVVLRIHTHDAGCPAALKECPSFPVADEIVWSGPAA